MALISAVHHHQTREDIYNQTEKGLLAGRGKARATSLFCKLIEGDKFKHSGKVQGGRLSGSKIFPPLAVPHLQGSSFLAAGPSSYLLCFFFLVSGLTPVSIQCCFGSLFRVGL